MTEHDPAASAAAALAEVIALHPGAGDRAAGGGPPADGPAAGMAERVTGALEFLRRRLTGDYTVDDFGFDPDFNETVVLPVLRPLFDSWFRVDVRGVENLPVDGPALLVANHAGTVPVDGLMLSVAVRDHHPRGRVTRMLAADLVFDTPVLGTVSRKAGHTLACHADAEALLGEGALVTVFPEGFKGVGKPFSERYRLQRFGRGGFVAAALRTGTPIVPVSIVGSEEIYPKIADITSLARLLGLPYFPVTPTFPLLGPLGAVPLPSKWQIEFDTPIPTADRPVSDAEDPMVLFELTDQVRDRIQQSLYRMLAARRSVFFG